MNVAYFIAKRYFKSKKTRNVINLITLISVIGISVSTFALVIVISAFNGIEDMVVKMYSDFDADLTIRSAKAKTFNQSFVPADSLSKLDDVEYLVRAVEEIVILKHEDKWVHATMIGVDTPFIELARIPEHMVDGEPLLYDDSTPLALFGASLLDKLDAYVSYSGRTREQITFHVPLREAKLRIGKNPLSVQRVGVAGRINYNREVNAEKVVVPYSLGRDLLNYGEDISAFYIGLKDGANLKRAKQRVQALVGEDFEVKTNLEKNELIFKTSKTERLIVIAILIFIFLLSSFNLVASLTMLFLEKKKDINTLYSMGAEKRLIATTFFYTGLMISGRGIVIGLTLGYILVFAQIYFSLLEMPGAIGEAFPMKANWSDAIVIILGVSMLGFLVSYLPTNYLVNRHERLGKKTE